MMEFVFNDLHDEAVAAIKGGDKEQELFSSALRERKVKISKMFQYLVDGTVDLFIEKGERSENKKSLIRTWTRSEKLNGKVRMTTWLCWDDLKKVSASSDHTSADAEDMIAYAEPFDGTVHSWSYGEPYPTEAEYFADVEVMKGEKYGNKKDGRS